MKKIFLLLSLLLIPSLVFGAANDHFDNMVNTLTNSGHLEYSLSMRTQAQVEANCACGGDCDQIIYDLEKDAIRMEAWLDFDEYMRVYFSDLTTGKVYIQVETYFGPNWAEHGNQLVGSKHWRLRKDDIGGDDRMLEIYHNADSAVTNTSASSPAGRPKVRVYVEAGYLDEDVSPTHGGTCRYDAQPGGDTASCYDDLPFTEADHVADSISPFLYLCNRWIRETFMLDMDNNRLQLWMSDEETPTTLLIADLDDSSLGYYLGTGIMGANGIQFGIIPGVDATIDPTLYNWHRNLIVGHNLSESEITSLLSGVPSASEDTTKPTFSSATINGTSVTITLTEDVTITDLDDGDFKFTGSTTGEVSINSCTENNGVISGTAASAFVNGETVTCAYSGDANEVEDTSSNSLDTFSGESVTNNTPAPSATGNVTTVVGLGPHTWVISPTGNATRSME